jgi:hypothetical protein
VDWSLERCTSGRYAKSTFRCVVSFWAWANVVSEEKVRVIAEKSERIYGRLQGMCLSINELVQPELF